MNHEESFSFKSKGWQQLILICAAKFLRTFGFGCISVILAIYLSTKGFSDAEVGAVLTATLLEDAIVSSFVAIIANKLGFRAVLVGASILITAGGLLMAFATAKPVLLLAVVLGIVSPAGYEGGPFAAIEQTLVSDTTGASKLTRAYSIYNLIGFAGAALGALAASLCKQGNSGQYTTLLLTYALTGLLLAAIYSVLDIKRSVNEKSSHKRKATTPELSPVSRFAQSMPKDSIFWKLVSLQSLDAFGGGFVVQTMISFWFYQRYHAGADFTGTIFFWCNIIAAFSFFVAPILAKRLGLLNTMVFTHLPCSLALCLIPLCPSAAAAGMLLLVRSAFSSMDIPVRQAYTMLVVEEKDRVAASALTTAIRSVAQAVGPMCASFALSNPVTGLPFIIAGSCKSTYDVGLFLAFRNVNLRDENADAAKTSLDMKRQELERTLEQELASSSK